MEFTIIGLPGIVSIAVVATIGYLIGRRPLSPVVEDNMARQEMKRAKAVLTQVAAISLNMRQSLAQHHSTVLQFKTRLDQFQSRSDAMSLRELTTEADRLLAPTAELAETIAEAYEGIRRQTERLARNSQRHIDVVTGIGNRLALEENMEVMLNLRRKCDVPFSIALFTIPGFDDFTNREGGAAAAAVLREAATVLDTKSRDSDQVARIGDDRFVVLLAKTPETGAQAFVNRMQQFLTVALPLPCTAGVAEATSSDTLTLMLDRAERDLKPWNIATPPATAEISESRLTRMLHGAAERPTRPLRTLLERETPATVNS